MQIELSIETQPTNRPRPIQVIVRADGNIIGTVSIKTVLELADRIDQLQRPIDAALEENDNEAT